jgi:glutathionylspermidine synthase
MLRNSIIPRNGWQQKVEDLGFGFHSTDVPYWDESAYYSFSLPEIHQIEKATQTLYDMCLHAVQYVIDNKLYTKFAIPEYIIPYIEATWNADSPAIYGRFDLCIKDGKIKMLEFNADTPTSLYEAGIVQWFWLEDYDKNKDQFNSIHEKLINYWAHLKPYLHDAPVHFTLVKDSLEDLTNVEYMRDCAMQAELDTVLCFIDDIGWDDEGFQFIDGADMPIQNMFKLYPWEWLVNEEFGKNILLDARQTHWIEPAWKMIMSNKAILPILWQLYPNHELLLWSSFNSKGQSSFVKKPILSREGANITLVENHFPIANSTGDYGAEGYIFQELFTLPNYNGNYPVIGSWIIGQEAAGIGIRESNGLITDNVSRFVPHLID